MKKLFALLLATVLVLSICGAATAEASSAEASTSEESVADVAWPNGDVTVYIPFDVGSQTDIGTRLILDYLSKATGVTFKPENDSTGAGARLAELCYNAEPDGQTLLVTSGGSYTAFAKGLWEHSVGDPDSYTPVCGLIQPNPDAGTCFMCKPDQPFEDVLELAEYAKEHPGEITVAVTAGKTNEVKTKVLFDNLGISENVRYVSADSSEILTGILGGNIDIGPLSEDVAAEYLISGDMKCLVDARLNRDIIGSEETVNALMQVPILTDLLDEETAKSVYLFQLALIVGPAGIPDELANKINDVAAGILDDPDYVAQIEEIFKGVSDYYYLPSIDEMRESVELTAAQISAVYEGEQQ